MERKLVLYIATTLDGYIARKDGGIDWLTGAEGEGDNGYANFYKSIDTIIMGNRTYNHVLELVREFPYPDKKCYVFSKTQTQKNKHVEFINEDVITFTNQLKMKSQSKIWLVGGSNILESFMKNQLVDEFIITIVPIILGNGIPLFTNTNLETKLTLKQVTRLGQLVQVHYEKK